MQDNRPYYFVLDKHTNNWFFIARNMPYESNMIPIEKWEIGEKTFLMMRVIYTKDQVSNLINNSDNMFSINKNTNKINLRGPDIYCVIDNNSKKTIATVWKPHINAIEIQYNGSHEILSETSTYTQIKNQLLSYIKKLYQGNINDTDIAAEDNNHIINML